MLEKILSSSILAGMLTGDIFVVLIVCLLVGIISAAYEFDQSRKSKEPDTTYDWFDLLLSVLGSVLTGSLGYFIASIFVSDPTALLVITIFTSLFGLTGLVNIKNAALKGIVAATTSSIVFLANKITGNTQANNNQNNSRYDRPYDQGRYEVDQSYFPREDNTQNPDEIPPRDTDYDS